MSKEKTAYDRLVEAVDAYSNERDQEMLGQMFKDEHWKLCLPAYWGPDNDGRDGPGHTVALTIGVEDTLNERIAHFTTLRQMLEWDMDPECGNWDWLEKVAKELRELADDLDKAAAVQREKWG